MKICDITQFYSPVSGGVKRYLGEKRAYMRDHTEDEHVLIIPGAKNGVEVDGRLRTYTIASPVISKTAQYRVLLSLRSVEEILERERPDLIESGDPYQVGWGAAGCGRALGIPVVGFYHSHFPEASIRAVSKYFGRMSMQMAEAISSRYVCSLYNRFERTLVPSPGLGQLLTQWGVGNVSNVDLGVNVEAFFPDDSAREAMRAKLGIPPGMRVLIYVGRLAPEKNVKTLLRAFELLEEQVPGKFCFVIIGDGTYRGEVAKFTNAKCEMRNAELKRQPVPALPSTSAIRDPRSAFDKFHLSYCSDAKELANWYRAADLMVHPSVNETFGLVTLESQACGTPVVGIRGSYMDRIIFTDQECWARENTPESLAAAIRAMGALSENELRGAGMSASQMVRSQYGWASVFMRLFAIYREVIAGYIK